MTEEWSTRAVLPYLQGWRVTLLRCPVFTPRSVHGTLQEPGAALALRRSSKWALVAASLSVQASKQQNSAAAYNV